MSNTIRVPQPLLQEIDESLEAALAKQAQPLTDEMIEAEGRKVFLPTINAVGEERRWLFVRGAKWARDRMPQQAQPLTDEYEPFCMCNRDDGSHAIGCPKAQQAQPTWTCYCGRYGLDEGMVAAGDCERHSPTECAARPQQAQPEMPNARQAAVAAGYDPGSRGGEGFMAGWQAALAQQAQPLRCPYCDYTPGRGFDKTWPHVMPEMPTCEMIEALKRLPGAAPYAKPWNAAIDAVLALFAPKPGPAPDGT